MFTRSDDGKMTPCSCNYSRLFQVVIVSYKTCTNCSGIKLIWEASGRIFFFREAGAKVVITTAKHEVIFTSLLKDIKGCEFNKLTKSTGKAQKNALFYCWIRKLLQFSAYHRYPGGCATSLFTFLDRSLQFLTWQRREAGEHGITNFQLIQKSSPFRAILI